MLAISNQQERSRVISRAKAEVAGDMRQRASFFHCIQESLFCERVILQRLSADYPVAAGLRFAEDQSQFPFHSLAPDFSTSGSIGLKITW